MKYFQRRSISLSFFGGLIAGFFAIAYRYNFNSDVDPDRYYHFALSRLMLDAKSFFLRQLPQVEGLGWQDFFAEKEFLFHQLTALGHRLGGDIGVQWLVWAIAAGAIIMFFLFAASRIGPLLAFLASLAFFFSPPILFRLQMVRPHVLAIFFFILLLAGITRRRPVWTALTTFLFCLAYHAFYIPLIVLVFALAADLYLNPRLDEARKKFYLWATAGLVAGIFLNPYFPVNIIMGLRIAYIPSLMAGELSNVGFGDELYSAQANFLLGGLFAPILVFLLAIWFLANRRAEGKEPFNLIFLFAASCIFLWMSFQSRRGVEYFIPTAAFLFVELVAGFRDRIRPAQRGFLAVAVLGFALMNFWDFRREVVMPSPIPDQLIASMSVIPRDSRKKVFNCEWDTTPYLLYARPDLRFIDIMDPSLLYFRDPEAHKARESLKAGEVADSYGMIKNAFGASFVLCRNQAVIAQMEDDPRFRRLFPASLEQSVSDRALYIYELREDNALAYAKEFAIARLPATNGNFRELAPESAVELSPRETGNLNYLNLASVWKEKSKQPDDEALCALVRPTGRSAKNLVGANYLTIGGGRNIRLWLNGKPLYNSVSAFLTARLHQVVVPLPAALKEGDRLDFIVCSQAKAKYWGLSVAGLRASDLAAACDWKQEYQAPRRKNGFPLSGAAKTCIGPFAQVMPPEAM